MKSALALWVLISSAAFADLGDSPMLDVCTEYGYARDARGYCAIGTDIQSEYGRPAICNKVSAQRDAMQFCQENSVVPRTCRIVKYCRPSQR